MSGFEKHSGTWKAVERRVQERLETARSRLESPGLDPATTEFERGVINMARAILSMADEDGTPSEPPAEETHFY